MKNTVFGTLFLTLLASPLTGFAAESAAPSLKPAIRMESSETVAMPGAFSEGWLTVDEPSCISGLGRPVGSLPLPVTVALFDEAGKEVVRSQVGTDPSAASHFERLDAPGYLFRQVKRTLAPGRYRLSIIGQLGEIFNPLDASQVLGPALLACSDIKVGLSSAAPASVASAPAGGGGSWLGSIPVLGGLGALFGGGSGAGSGIPGFSIPVPPRSGFHFPNFGGGSGPICL
jgi:hypothetical protein